jgi:hypothetical protein
MASKSDQDSLNKQHIVHFCTFSDSRLQPTLTRIKREAELSKYFKNIYVYNEFNLNSQFKREFKNILKYHVKGYGFWIWKVSIILDSLHKIESNEYLLYADSGCTINKNGLGKFLEYLNLVENSDLGILAVCLTDDFIESKYTKGDVLDFFNVRESSDIINSAQRQASILLIKKHTRSLLFFQDLLKIYNKNSHLLNDTHFSSPNNSDFVAHRHDQSIFSVLHKIRKGAIIPNSDVWVDNNDFEHYLSDSPIWVTRKKNRKIIGVPYIFINGMKYFFNRFIKS